MNITKMSNLDLAIAEAQGKVKVTRLATRKPKKSELVMTRVGGCGTRFYAATGKGRNGIEQELRIRAVAHSWSVSNSERE